MTRLSSNPNTPETDAPDPEFPLMLVVEAGNTETGLSVATNTAAEVRIVVAGDTETGKSSLINAAANDAIDRLEVPWVLPPTRLPEDMFPDPVPVTVIDTFDLFGEGTDTEIELQRADDVLTLQRADDVLTLQRADVVVLTYSYDCRTSFLRLSTFWLPKLQQLGVKVPVIVAGCMCELRKGQKFDYEKGISSLMRNFSQVQSCIDCSAYKHIQISEVFCEAQKAVLHPIGPLINQKTLTLKPQCVWALKRIFNFCDNDRDGALSDADLNDLQVKCFDAPLQSPSVIKYMKDTVVKRCTEGVNENGLTLSGFLLSHTICIENGHPETTWGVLRKFGYNNDLRLGDDQLLPPIKRTPDQSVELTSEAVEFLRGVFFSPDRDCVCSTIYSLLKPLGIMDSSHWSEAPYDNAAESNAFGGLSLNGFLAQWALMTLLNPGLSVENLIYLGYADDPSSAVRVTRGRCVDRKQQHSDRNVFQCFVFGPKEAGKSSLLQSFVGSPFSETYTPTTEERCTVNIVDQPGGTQKTLILREIPEDAIENLLFQKDALAACDIAVFVHDSFDESSWLRATELLVQVASYGESTGYQVPCLIVAAKDDLEPYPTAIQDSTRASQDMGIEAPIRISTKLGDFNNVFRRIVRAAEHPHLSIPEIEAGKTRKHYHRLVNRSLMVVSVVAAGNIVGLAAYRVFATLTKKASSS